MKGNLRKIVVFCLIMLLTFTTLTACDSLFKFNSKLTTPNVSVVGNTIYWDAVEGAVNYEIYQNDSLLTTVTDTHYVMSENNVTSQIYVVAKDSDSSKDSEKSNKVVVYKQADFTEEESMHIALSSGGYTIPTNINYVQITGSSSNAYIVVADRTTDLFIELLNVTITSPEGKSCIMSSDGSYDASAKRYGVTIKVTGTNVLTGGDYTSVPSTPSDNSGKKGTQGGDGGSGIVLPLVAITGDGSLTLNGGKGGAGGTGAASSGWSTARYGNGGNGGSGGCGIKTTTVIVSMSITGIIKAYGGLGGAKGAPGSNGSVVSGPLNTSNWSNCYGSVGSDGSSLVGDIKQFCGTYISE